MTARLPWRAGFLAAGLSALTNALIFALAVAAGVFASLWLRPDAPGEMFVGPIVLVSVLGALAGAGVYVLLRKWSRQPERTFAVVAGVVLLLSLAAPFAIPGTTVAQGLVLNLMHVVVAAFTVGLLLRR